MCIYITILTSIRHLLVERHILDRVLSKVYFLVIASASISEQDMRLFRVTVLLMCFDVVILLLVFEVSKLC